MQTPFQKWNHISGRGKLSGSRNSPEHRNYSKERQNMLRTSVNSKVHVCVSANTWNYRINTCFQALLFVQSFFPPPLFFLLFYNPGSDNILLTFIILSQFLFPFPCLYEYQKWIASLITKWKLLSYKCRNLLSLQSFTKSKVNE